MGVQKKRMEKDLFSWLVAIRSALQDFLVLHDWVGEGAMRFGFDGHLGGCAWVLGSDWMGCRGVGILWAGCLSCVTALGSAR